MRTRYFSGICLFALSCTALSPPQTAAENQGGYTYIPIDPFPIVARTEDEQTLLSELASTGFSENILALFPDNAVRLSVETFDSSGNVSYGISQTSASGQVFRVTTDFINSDTANFPVRIGQLVQSMAFDPDTHLRVRSIDQRPLSYALDNFERNVGYVVEAWNEVTKNDEPEKWDVVNIPIYIGVGLRITADLVAIKSGANVNGIGAIGIEAEAERIRGVMVIQTLGINGKSVSAALPIQSELNPTTIQNAATSIGSIKALLYTKETTIYPRLVGLYLPFRADKALVNKLISELSAHPPRWNRLSDIVQSRQAGLVGSDQDGPPSPNP